MNIPRGVRRAALAVVPMLALLLAATGARPASAAIVLDTTLTFSACENDTCIGTICYTVKEHVIVRTEGGKCGIHIDIHGTGTGPNGERYVINAAENEQLDDCSGSTGCAHLAVNIVFAGQGRAPNLYLHETAEVCCCPFTIDVKSMHIRCN